MKESYDVVIVGAGPAGCIAAMELAEKYEVLLVDWSSFPRDKPCGAVLVEESLEFLREQKLKLPNSVYSRPKKLDMEYIDWDNGIKIKEKRGFKNVSRRNFDFWLLNLAKENVDFSQETKFVESRNNSDNVKVVLEKGNKRSIVECQYLIGADGALSSVRKSLGFKKNNNYFAFQEWLQADLDMENHLYFIYDKKITDFYSWVIPKDEYLLVGSAVKGNQMKQKFEHFREKLSEKLGINSPKSKREGAVLSRPESLDDIFLGSKRTLLLGEAAGLISPSSSEGISFAMRSGLNCSEAIKKENGKVLPEYKKISKPLLKEIEEKFEKSEMLSHHKQRKKYFNSLK